MSKMLSVKTEALLLIAGIVWLIAGINIANLGAQAYFDMSIAIIPELALASLAVFLVFIRFVFSRLVRKHADRVARIEDTHSPFWMFFDRKGYLIMIVMMGGGIALRLSGLVPELFIAFFYTGLGLALAVSGVLFILQYRKQNARNRS